MYRLRLDVRIEQLDEHGSIVYPSGLQVTQDMTLQADNFLEIAHVLGRFHELAEDIKRRKDIPDAT